MNDTSGNTFNILTIDGTSVTAEAHTEGTQPTDDGGKDITFGQKSLGVSAFNTEWVRWSVELNVDSVLNIDSFLGPLLGKRMVRIANSKLTTADEIIDLVHSVDPAYRFGSAALITNNSTLAVVHKLKGR